MRIFRPALRVIAIASTISLGGCLEKGPVADAELEDAESYQAEKADRDSIRERLSELRAEKKSLESELKSLTKAASEKPEVMAKELELSTRLESIRSYSASLDALDSELEAGLEVWRPATRNSFKGVVLPEITTTDGRQFTGVTLKEVTDENLVFLHAGGEDSVPILQLPVGLRRNLIHESTVLVDQPASSN